VTPAILTRGLTKRFGSLTAVDSVELEVPPGDVYGFLGPNGSGKTTTVRMLLGLVLPTSGTVEVLGSPIPRGARQVLHRVGALVEAPAAYGHLGARTNLALLDAAGPGGSRRTRRARIDEALEQVGLAGIGRRPVKAYSLGMRQRLGIAAALIRKPELLILDEPTNGLDPRGIHEIRDLLLGLNATGTTVFLSSHLLAEVEQLCKRVGVVDRGRLVLQDSLAALRAPTGRVMLRTPDPEWAVSLLDGSLRDRAGDRLWISATDAAALNARLVGHGIRVSELAEERRSLEDVVLEATSAGSDRVELDPAAVAGLDRTSAGLVAAPAPLARRRRPLRSPGPPDPDPAAEPPAEPAGGAVPADGPPGSAVPADGPPGSAAPADGPAGSAVRDGAPDREEAP
jgi:ABC-type multidrug transport system ATPase subunit